MLVTCASHVNEAAPRIWVPTADSQIYAFKRLRADPIQKLLCGRDPVKGEELA